jgi:hypothetical protein
MSAPPGDQDTLTDAIAGSTLKGAVPNPATGHTTIETYITSSDALLQPALIIRNTAGNPVFRQALKEGYNSITVQTNVWQPGLYFYSLELMNKAKLTKKLTVVQ